MRDYDQWFYKKYNPDKMWLEFGLELHDDIPDENGHDCILINVN